MCAILSSSLDRLCQTYLREIVDRAYGEFASAPIDHGHAEEAVREFMSETVLQLFVAGQTVPEKLQRYAVLRAFTNFDVHAAP